MYVDTIYKKLKPVHGCIYSESIKKCKGMIYLDLMIMVTSGMEWTRELITVGLKYIVIFYFSKKAEKNMA